MTLLIIAYLGGALTILSPCILPVLPFVFARAEQSFIKSTLPMLAGMAATFAVVATLAAVGGSWAVHANEYGRYTAIALLALFGLMLLMPDLATKLTGPIVSFANGLTNSTGGTGSATFGSSLVLGIATGLLWAPCAGPVLGLVLTGAALQGASVATTLLLAAYAAGAATSLALALLIGGRVFVAMKQSLGTGEWVRRGLGIAVLAGVGAIAFGADTSFLARLSLAGTSKVEQALIDAIHPAFATSPATRVGDAKALASGARPGVRSKLPVEGAFPSLDGAVEWLNSQPLTADQLRGKVVLIDFWTYSCINCIRTVPYVRAWAKKYKDQGLVVIGVHTPEFAFEKKIENVKRGVTDFDLPYPVAVDNNFKIWRAFSNSYWPAHYFIDANGQIRHHHFGEGEHEESERVIQDLLAEAGKLNTENSVVKLDTRGAEAAPDLGSIQSQETYIGYQRASNFVSPEGVKNDAERTYSAGQPRLNEWSLQGKWTVGAEQATLNQEGGGLTYRFRARDLHLVLGSSTDGKPIRFNIKIDGRVPGESHGADVDAAGNGTVTQTRLYQLVRQAGDVRERTFEIWFLDPGLEAFVFTFG